MAIDPHKATLAAGVHEKEDAPHLPHGSVWPFWLGMAIAAVGFTVILWGRHLRLREEGAGGNPMLAVGLLAVAVLFLVLMVIGWVSEDFRWWKTNTGTGIGMPRAGTLMFISSEVFIFGALFSAYFTFQRLAEHWPDVEHFPLPIGTTAVFTLFLFSSSFTIHKAEGFLRAGNKKAFNKWWLATIVLGLVFLGGQVMEYVNLIAEGETLGSSQFMTSFFMLTGTHGLHVFGGLVALTFAYVRSLRGNFDEHRHAYVESVAMYWHFVDLVWVFVFSTLYLVPKYVLGA